MILITGASSGIGKSCAEIFGHAKQSLILIARRKERLHELKLKLEAEHGIDVHCFELDISQPLEVEKFAEQNKTLLTKVTVLINNAGLAKGLSPLQEGNWKEWDQMIDTNLKGLLYITHCILPHFTEKKRGHIINIGSVAGRWTYPKGNIYCATKSAVKSLTEALRMDLSGMGIRVTEIAPGMVETEFSLVRLGDPEKAKAVYSGIQPLTPEDIAKIVNWCVQQPPHVNIQEVVVYPTDQASPTVVNRK